MFNRKKMKARVRQHDAHAERLRIQGNTGKAAQHDRFAGIWADISNKMAQYDESREGSENGGT